MDVSKNILYIAGGRGVLGKSPGRKITSILDCWRMMGHKVRARFGGDFAGGVGRAAERGEFGNSQYYQKWYRRVTVLEPCINSCSERRDIQHHKIMVDPLASLCVEFQPDLIWERSYRLLCPGLEMAKRFDVPYVLEWKDHLIPYKFSLFRKRALNNESRKVNEADYIVVESNVLKDLLTSYGVDKTKIFVAHNAADPCEFKVDLHGGQKLRSSLSINENDVLVGYLGSYAFYHDTQLLVRAAQMINEQIGTSVKFLMIGNGEQYARTRAIAEKLKLIDKTLFMLPGVPMKDVPRILSSLDIAVLPGSTDIICPVKVQEYMALSLPCVIPGYSCNSEVVTDGETGLFFEPKNAKSLAESISTLAKDHNLRQRLGARARQEVIAHFTWEATWGVVLKKILSRSCVRSHD